MTVIPIALLEESTKELLDNKKSLDTLCVKINRKKIKIILNIVYLSRLQISKPSNITRALNGTKTVG